MLVKIDKFVILDMPEDVKIPLIHGRPFLSTAHAKINVFKRKISLKVGNNKLVYKCQNPVKSIIRGVYVLGLRERMDLYLEDRFMGETLVNNESLETYSGDYIELNDLNLPIGINDQFMEDFEPEIEEGEIVD